MKKVIASLLAALLVFACAPAARAEVTPPPALVFDGNTVYVAARDAKLYAEMLEQTRKTILQRYGASASALDVELKQPGTLSTGDTIRAGDDTLTIALVGASSAGNGDPADAYQEMTALAERSDMIVFQKIVLNCPNGEMLRTGPFTFAVYFGSDNYGYLFALYHADDRAEVAEFLDDVIVVQPLAEETAGRGNYYLSFFGDVDLDGKITARDARITLRASALLEKLDSVRFLAADLDGNGRITAAEARRILRVSAKLDAFA